MYLYGTKKNYLIPKQNIDFKSCIREYNNNFIKKVL